MNSYYCVWLLLCVCVCVCVCVCAHETSVGRVSTVLPPSSVCTGPVLVEGGRG